jgi:hypothetical protein
MGFDESNTPYMKREISTYCWKTKGHECRETVRKQQESHCKTVGIAKQAELEAEGLKVDLAFYKPCVGCGTRSTESKRDYKRCSRCKIAIYCSEACQRKDWPHHRGFCFTPVEKR